MKERKEFVALINKTIEEIRYPDQAQGLFAPISYILSLGGKRIRPLLALMANEMFGGDTSDVIMPAIGVEVFHNFTLLHDDLMDNADKRRGEETVHIKWNDNTAILSGDAMQIMAYQFIAQTKPEILQKVLNLFSHTALEICEGQQYDMEFEDRSNVSEEEYLEMIRLKTAVLLGCSLKIGAITGGANEDDANLLYEFGEKIGLAFQLKDDLLDVYADTNVFGKNIGGDILNNKKTFLLISALKLADEKLRQKMDEWISLEKYDPKEKIEFFTEAYGSTGAKDLCEKMMNLYFSQGMNALAEVSVSHELKSSLKMIAQDLMYRES